MGPKSSSRFSSSIVSHRVYMVFRESKRILPWGFHEIWILVVKIPLFWLKMVKIGLKSVKIHSETQKFHQKSAGPGGPSEIKIGVKVVGTIDPPQTLERLVWTASSFIHFQTSFNTGS